MNIKKPKTTISDFEFSDLNEADTVAFFDPTINDDRGGFAVVRKEDAQLIKAAEDLRDALITSCFIITSVINHEPIRRRFDQETREFFNKTVSDSKHALKKAGCEIGHS